MPHHNSSTSYTPIFRAWLNLLLLNVTIVYAAHLCSISAQTPNQSVVASPTSAADHSTQANTAATPAAKPTIMPKPTATSSPTASPTPAITEAPGQELRKELEQLVTISGETRDLLKQRDSTPGWLKKLDDALDASLTATLAGLALAAAAFLLSLQPKVVEEAVRNRNLNLVDQVERAVKCMILAFYGFTIALIDSLSIDPTTDIGEGQTWKSFVDLIGTGGGVASGIVLMVIGSWYMLKVTGTRPPSIRNGFQERIADQANAAKQVGPATTSNNPSVRQRAGKLLSRIFRRTLAKRHSV